MKRLEVLRTINLSSLRNEKSVDNLIGEAKRQGAIDCLDKLDFEKIFRYYEVWLFNTHKIRVIDLEWSKEYAKTKDFLELKSELVGGKTQ